MNELLAWVPFPYAMDRLRGRVQGLTDDEYRWAPAPGVSTIEWRLTHIADTLGEERNWLWLGHEPLAVGAVDAVDGDADEPPTAAGGLARLESAYGAWVALVGSIDAEAVFRPLGPTAGPYRDDLVISFVMHIFDELVHHAAEVGLVRDLYRARH